jgi:hypothetical protein
VNWQPEDEWLFVNLEGPVLNEEVAAKLDHSHFQSKKAGPLLWNSSLPISTEKTVFNLANNHFMDFGNLGVDCTFDLIEAIGALAVGYGKNAESSRRPLRINVDNKSISIISACENQFGCSTTNNPGVAGFASWIFPAIVREKLLSDYVIVSFHGGAEDYALPAPFFQDLYRSFVDLGADFVIGHHPHTPQGFEQYANGFIAYGLGNFAVNPKSWNENPLNLISLGVRINFDLDTPTVSICYFQLLESIEKAEIVEVDGHLKTVLDEYFTSLNRVISVRENLELVWKNIAFKLWDESIADFLNANALEVSLKSKMRKALKFGFNSRKIRSSLSRMANDRRLLTLHAISCESHSQVIATVLSESMGLSSEEIKQYSTIFPRLDLTS